MSDDEATGEDVTPWAGSETITLTLDQLWAAIIVGVGGEHDEVPTTAQVNRAVSIARRRALHASSAEEAGSGERCKVTGGNCDPSYAWSAPRLARKLNQVHERLGLPLDTPWIEVLAALRAIPSEGTENRDKPCVWKPDGAI